MIEDAIAKEIRIDAPIEVVWQTITDPGHLCRWFVDEAEVDLRPGGDATIAWKDHGVTETVRIETVDEPNVFSFRWMNPKGEAPNERNSTLVEFRLRTDGDGTILNIVERGFAGLDWSDDTKASTIEGHVEGWTIHTNSLEKYFASNREVPARA